MKIVIELPDEDYQVTLTKIMLACNGCKITELPKGYGRLIDADKCLNLAWQNLYKREDEMEKKFEDYVPIKRFHEQRGFEVCLQTLVNAPTIIEADKEGRR